MPAAIPGPPPIANATVAGLLSAVAQSIGGDKTFVGKIINSLPLGLVVYTTGTLPAAAGNTGAIVYNSTTSKVMFSTGSAWIALDVSSGSFVLNTGDTMTGQLNITGAGISVDTADQTFFVDAAGNKVGIGTTSPADKLDVATGGVAVRGATAASGAGVFLSHAASVTTISSVNFTGPVYRDLILSAGTLSLRTGTSSVTEWVKLGATGNVAFDTNTMFVDAVNNRVGILTITPSQPLEVAGIVYSTSGGFKFPDNTTQITAAVPLTGGTMTGALVLSSAALTITGAGMDIDSADHTLFVDATNNRVGIATNAPARVLDVRGNVTSDHLAQFENTNANGSSGITFLNNAGTERFRVGYANATFGAPLQGLCFLSTDAATDLIIAHGSTEYHRFLNSGVVKFDQADSLLVIDATNNRIGVLVAAPSSSHLMDLNATTGTGNHALKIRQNSTDGYAGIEFFTSSNSTGGSIAYGNASVTAGAGVSTLSINVPTGLAIRNGATTYHTFVAGGNVTLGTANNSFFVDITNSRTGINTVSPSAGVAGFTHPITIDLGTTGTRSALIRGGGTIRKGLAIQDSTNNRTWTWDHSTSGNNNRLECFYHDGTSEFRILSMTTGGRLGINNTTPGVELDVAGAGQFTLGLTVDTNTLVVDNTQHSVGIGTTPAAGNKLHVSGKSQFGAANQYFGVNSITAFATGGQASATQLTGEVNYVTTVATTGDSVKLTTAALGLKVTVFNLGTNSVNIFPTSGGAIDALGTDTAFALASGSAKTFWGQTATQWRSI